MILALLTSRMCSLFEEGGTMFSFGEACEKCNKKICSASSGPTILLAGSLLQKKSQYIFQISDASVR